MDMTALKGRPTADVLDAYWHDPEWEAALEILLDKLLGLARSGTEESLYEAAVLLHEPPPANISDDSTTASPAERDRRRECARELFPGIARFMEFAARQEGPEAAQRVLATVETKYGWALLEHLERSAGQVWRKELPNALELRSEPRLTRLLQEFERVGLVRLLRPRGKHVIVQLGPSGAKALRDRPAPVLAIEQKTAARPLPGDVDWAKAAQRAESQGKGLLRDFDHKTPLDQSLAETVESCSLV
jgi:hypothetical protein